MRNGNIQAKCIVCGELYRLYPTDIGIRVTCGKTECKTGYKKSFRNKGAFKSRGMRVGGICSFCGKHFRCYMTLIRRGYGKYCSHKCYSLHLTKHSPLSKKIRQRINFRIMWALKRGRSRKLFTLVELIGCDVETYKKHLEKQFVSGMSWDNYGLHGWHIDHIRPLASFNLSDPEEQKLAFYYKNTQPLWAVDNIKKGCKY